MERWVVTAKRADFQAIGERFQIDPVTARIIRNRDVTGEEAIEQYLNGGLEDLYDPWLMKDMEKAADMIVSAVKQKKKIRIIGDYDIDGVMSTYILVTGLCRAGAIVDTYIPDRISDGYGIHRHLIEKALEDGVDTIITCDNGIAASEEIEYAREKGMTLLVTDHHEIPYREEKGEKIWVLPPADAIINPTQPDCPYPFKNICGGVVAFKIVSALYEAAGIAKKELESFYEFAAIATVGDVMDLQGENRIIVKEGLKRLSHTENPGLKALIQANHLEKSHITAYHIGFVLGPCINASGRLDTASRSLKLLCAKSMEEAQRLAGDLTSLNVSRKALTEQGKEQAFARIDSTDLKEDRVLVVYLENCHESLAGIIAGRIREQYHKPVFVLTDGASCVKGSGRSIEAYSMYEELVKCADLLEQFGGHPMAAGLSLKKENVEAFRKRLNANCTLTGQDLIPKIVIDVPMPVSYVSKKLITQISLLEPFGKGNTRPLFAQKNLRVLNGRILGKNQNVAKMLLMDERGFTIDGIYFGEAKEFLDFAEKKDSVSITYYPDVNCYQGRETIQAVIQNYC